MSTVTLAARVVKVPVGPFLEGNANVPIVLYLDDYPEFTADDRSRLIIRLNGKEVSSQLDDLNADGVPDQLAFLVDTIAAGQRLHYQLLCRKHHRAFAKEVHAEMYRKSKEPQEGYVYHEAEGKQFYIAPVTEATFFPGEDSYHSMHHHGVAFESSLMAYRIYFDKKQTIDVYAKKTPQLELDACKWYPTDEQLADGFGDDILRVSGYIGVGTYKPYNGEKMIHFDNVLSRTERIVSQGNIRTICQIEDHGWVLPTGDTVDVVTRYTLYARHRDVMVEVFCSAPVEWMCTGVQKVGAPNYFSDASNGAIAASWGTAFPVNDSIKYGRETVGLAVYVPQEYHRSSVEDKNNNLILLQPNTYLRYYFTVVSQKELCPPVSGDQEFWKYVMKWAQQLSHL